MRDSEFDQINLKLLVAISTLKGCPEKIGGITPIERQHCLAHVFMDHARSDFRRGGSSLVRQKWSFFVRETTGMEL
jgi:hypothetical protein